MGILNLKTKPPDAIYTCVHVMLWIVFESDYVVNNQESITNKITSKINIAGNACLKAIRQLSLTRSLSYQTLFSDFGCYA